MSSESVIPAPATPDVCTMSVIVDGSEISGRYHLLSVTVTKELNRIPSAVIQFQDGEASSSSFGLSDSELFVPGNEIEIRLGYRSNNDTVFKGIVVKHGIKIRKNISLLVVECRDDAVRMTGKVRSRYFSGMRDSEIISEIIDYYRIAKDVKGTVPELKEITQYNSTDWDFILCRAEVNGFVVKVNDGKITAAPPDINSASVVSVSYGATVLEFDAELDARRHNKGISTGSWDPSGQGIVEMEAKEPAVMMNGNIASGKLAGVIDSDTLRIMHGGRLSRTELQAWADGRLLKDRLAKVRGRVKFQGFAGVQPGDVIELKGVGERFEGKLYVSGVRHSVTAGNWETDVQLGLGTELFAETYNLRPLPASGLLPAISGLQIGIVTMLENDPDGEERIKVRIPLVSESDEGTWSRIATLDAGKNRGTFFRPEIGDEVIVGFLNDDPCQPVVLGGCHSSAMPAPEPAKDDNHRKGYASRENMKLVFDDEKKVISIETPAGNSFTLTEEEKGIVIKDQNGNIIRLDDGGVKIESIKDLAIKAAGDIKIEGMNIELKAGTGFKTTAGSTAEVSGSNTTIKGNSATVIKGGVVQINC